MSTQNPALELPATGGTRRRPCSALELAALAGLLIVRSTFGGAVHLDPVLFIGPKATPGAVATIACRRRLQRRGVHDEARVRALVEKEGFAYVAARLRQQPGLLLTFRRVAARSKN